MLKGEECEEMRGAIRLYNPDGVIVERDGMQGARDRTALTVV